MARPQPLKDKLFNDELDRMQMMKRFPEGEIARQEMIRTMRTIGADNSKFLHELITFFVDNYPRCPTPHELIERTGIMRTAAYKPLGKAGCLKCSGTGWVHTRRRVKITGMQSYDADFAERCECAPPAP